MYVNEYALVAQQNALQGTASAQSAQLEAFKDATAGSYLWQSNLTSQQFESFLVFKNRTEDGRYFMQDFLTLLGENRRVPGYSQSYGWAEHPADNYGYDIDTVVSGVGTAQLTIDTTRTEVLAQQYDLLNFASSGGFQAQVVSAAISGGLERLVLERVDGANWAAGDATAGDTLGDAGNAWPEKSAQPDGRVTYPTPYFNKYSITKATNAYSGDAITAGGGIRTVKGMGANGEPFETYVLFQESEMIDRFQKQREDLLMWSEESVAGAPVTKTRGMVRDVISNANASVLYTSPMDEADLRSYMDQADQLNDHDHHFGLAGGAAWRGLNSGLATYLVQGAHSYGTFNPDSYAKVGVKIDQYTFADKTISMKRYRGFDDKKTTGVTAAAPSATDIDFSEFVMFLNMGENAGTDREGTKSGLPYVSYRYKALGGVDRSIVVGFLKGMTGRFGNEVMPGMIKGGSDANQIRTSISSNQVSSSLDCDEMFLLSQMGPQLLCVDTAHGFMRASA